MANYKKNHKTNYITPTTEIIITPEGPVVQPIDGYISGSDSIDGDGGSASVGGYSSGGSGSVGGGN